jgi:hypothetical protein
MSRCGSHRLEGDTVVVVARVLSGLYITTVLSPQVSCNKINSSAPAAFPPPPFLLGCRSSLISTPDLVGLYVALGLSWVDLHASGCSNKLAPIWVVCLGRTHCFASTLTSLSSSLMPTVTPTPCGYSVVVPARASHRGLKAARPTS